MHVGRVPLYLLDCNVEGNRPEDRELTSRLYGGDERTRIRQELVLGVGGVKALAGAGDHPGRVSFERGPQRVRAAGGDPRADAGRRTVVRRGAPRAWPGRRCSPPTRPCRPATTAFTAGWWRSTWARCATSWGSRIEQLMGLGRVEPHNEGETVLHDRPGPEAVAARQCRQSPCTGTFAAHVGAPLALAGRRGDPDRPHHQRRPQSQLAGLADAAAVRPALPGRLDPAAWASRKPGRTSTAWIRANCGRRTIR